MSVILQKALNFQNFIYTYIYELIDNPVKNL